MILEYADLVGGKDLSKEIFLAYGPGGLGICGVRGVPGLEEARRRLLPLAHRLAQLPTEVLERYERPEAHYCVGWSRGREKFKGLPDMAKGSFYANPMWDDPAQGDEEVREKPLGPIFLREKWFEVSLCGDAEHLAERGARLGRGL